MTELPPNVQVIRSRGRVRVGDRLVLLEVLPESAVLILSCLFDIHNKA